MDQLTVDFDVHNEALCYGSSEPLTPPEFYPNSKSQLERAGLLGHSDTVEALRIKARAQMAAWLCTSVPGMKLAWVTNENMLVSTTPAGAYARPIQTRNEGWHRDGVFASERLILGLANFSIPSRRRRNFAHLQTEYALTRPGKILDDILADDKEETLAAAITAGVASGSVRLWPNDKQAAGINGKFVICPGSTYHRLRKNTTNAPIKRLHYRMWVNYASD